METTEEDVRAVRAAIIELRDTALSQDEMQWSIILSHAIALLHELQEIKRLAALQKKEV